MAKKSYPWQKKSKSSLLALEPRMLFDGAAAATPAPEPVLVEAVTVQDVALGITRDPTATNIESLPSTESLDVDSVAEAPVSASSVFEVSKLPMSEEISLALKNANDLIGQYLSKRLANTCCP